MHVASRISGTASRWRCHCWHFPMFSILNCCILDSGYHKLPLDGAVIGTFWYCSDSDSKSNSTNWTWPQILATSKFEKGPRAEYYQCRASTASDVGIKLHGCGTANVALPMWQWQCGSDSGVVWQRQERTQASLQTGWMEGERESLSVIHWNMLCSKQLQQIQIQKRREENTGKLANRLEGESLSGTCSSAIDVFKTILTNTKDKDKRQNT